METLSETVTDKCQLSHMEAPPFLHNLSTNQTGTQAASANTSMQFFDPKQQLSDRNKKPVPKGRAGGR